MTVLKRLGALLLTLLAVHLVAFLLLRAAKGGPFDSERELAPEARAALEAQYHLDDPWLVQYGYALGGALRGDFGQSMRYQDVSVNTILADAFPISLVLGLGALLLAVALGIPAGLMAALSGRGWRDRGVQVTSTLLLSTPNFVLAGFAVLLFSFGLGWLPPAGGVGWRAFALPCLCLALPTAAQLARLTRSSASDVLREESPRAARARGLAASRVRGQHVLRPALAPLLAFLGPTAAALLTGSLVIEQIFALPGLGAHFVQAALNRDYTLALGITVSYTALLGLLTLLADLAMAKLDPRVESLS